jgi:2-amino-4-hydroxy-6-hydroxymethyldihydropteridine diphosphokinase
MVTVYLSLGSNDRPEDHLPAAVAALRAQFDVRAVSRAYQGPAVGGAGAAVVQPYVNAAAIIVTNLTPEACKERLRAIEAQLGRTRGKAAPVTIDLDIVIFGHEIIQLGKSEIPDPHLYEYAHLAIPLAEIAPQAKHPLTADTLQAIADMIGDHDLQPHPTLVLG